LPGYEAERLVCVHLLPGNDKQLKELFHTIDADNSGDIDIDEMKSALLDDEIRQPCLLSGLPIRAWSR